MIEAVTQLRNELRLLQRHPMIWSAVIATFAFGAAAAFGVPIDPEEPATEAVLWFNVLFPIYILPFLAGALAPVFYLREIDHNLTEIIGSYQVEPRKWLIARVGSFVIVMLAACILSQIAFVTFLWPDFPGEGSAMLASAVGAILVLQLPNIVLWATILAWVASRRPASSLLYLSAAMLWLVYNGVASLSGSPMISSGPALFEPLRELMLVVDPYASIGLLATANDTCLLDSCEVNLAVNRSIWLVFSAVLLLGIRSVPTRLAPSHKPAAAGAAKAAKREALAGHLAFHLRFVVRDKAFPLLVIGWLLLLLPEVAGGMNWVEPLSMVEADSRDALNRIAWLTMIGAGTLLMLYFADRVCRLYSNTNMQELYAATPHGPLRMIATQLVSVWLLALGFVVLAGGGVLVVQSVLQSPIQLGEFGVQLSITFSRLALFAGLFVVLHGLIRARYLANLAGLLVIALSLSSLLPAIGLSHPLWRPLGSPIFAPDHYWGFGGSLAGHWYFSAFWALVGAALSSLAVAAYHRNLAHRQTSVSALVRHPGASAFVASLAIAGFVGYSIDRPLRAEGALDSYETKYAWRAAYERNYSSWAKLAQPDIEMIDLRADLHPSRHRANLNAKLTLINRSDEEIARVLVGRNQFDFGSTRLRMDAPSTARHDEAARQTVFTLDEPLEPGERIHLQVDLTVQQSELRRPGAPLILRPEFTSLPVHALIPIIGFDQTVMLRDVDNRETFSLPALDPVTPSRIDKNSLRSIANDRVMIDTLVTTEGGHWAVGQGALVGRWEEGGRDVFQYRTSQPIRAMTALFSVPWEPQVWNQGTTAIQVFAPETVSADDPNVIGMQDTLSFLGQEIAPYRGSTLSLLAVPEIGFTGYALPQIVQLSHRFSFRAKPVSGAGFDQRYRRSVHETSHQWFGHAIGHGAPDDRAFLVESLAKYIELVMIERRFGKRSMEALVAYELDRYRNASSSLETPIAPLVDATESYDQYSRATIAFACLRQRMGDEPILRVLRDLFAQSEVDGRAIVSMDFVDGLIAAQPRHTDAIQTLLLGTEPLARSLDMSDCATLDTEGRSSL